MLFQLLNKITFTNSKTLIYILQSNNKTKFVKIISVCSTKQLVSKIKSLEILIHNYSKTFE